MIRFQIKRPCLAIPDNDAADNLLRARNLSERRVGPASLFMMCSILSILGGCAANTLRVEGAAAVGKAASAFTDSASTALASAKARRVEANATLVASDPSCEPLAKVNIYVRMSPTATPAPLCADGLTPRPGYAVQSLDLRPWPEEALKPTMLLIGALGDYGAALSKVAERPDADIGKELASLATKANEAGALAKGLLGLEVPDAEKALASKQGEAALKLLAFANTLAEEQTRVRDIRTIVDQRGALIANSVPDIEAQLSDWLTIHAQSDAQIIQNNLLRAYRNERGRWDYSQRLIFVSAVNNARFDAAVYPQRLRALKQGLVAFVDAEKDLRRLLRGEFTAKERQRIAALDQQRMLEALGLMARAVTAFGGL